MQNSAWRDVLTSETIEARPVEPIPCTDCGHGFVPPFRCSCMRGSSVIVARIRFLAVRRTTWNFPR
jgi:hypothetical protein